MTYSKTEAAAVERLRTAMREAKEHEKVYTFSLLDEGSWPKDMRELRRASKALLKRYEELHALVVSAELLDDHLQRRRAENANA